MSIVEKIRLNIQQVENGYIITDDVAHMRHGASKTYVARNPSRLAQLIEELAVVQICEQQTKTKEGIERERSKRDIESGPSRPSEKHSGEGCTGFAGDHFDPKRPSHDGIDRAGRR
jgi:hypothetical protein